MRKIKILLTSFVIFLVLSMDLGGIFAPQAATAQKVETEAAQEKVFDFAHLQYNLGCIGNAVKGAVAKQVKGVAQDTADKYAEAVADQTTKAVEDVIKEKTQE